MAKRNKYVAINLTSFEVKLCSSKDSLSSAIKTHKNNLTALKERDVVKGWLVVTVTEE
jgi:hypothetical protein